MVSRFSIHETRSPTGRSRYEFDIVLRGPGATPFEERALSWLGTTPSQTVGPYFAIGLPWADGPVRGRGGHAGRDLDRGHVSTAPATPVPDALIETWQADPDGRFAHPTDTRGASSSAGLPRLRPLRPSDGDGRSSS